jgi:hypothetical protein
MQLSVNSYIQYNSVITAGGWRPTRQNVEAMVVLMGLDNGAYYEEDEEGTRRLPRKDEENVYHVEGKLV